jgi:hypothetical protein
MSKDDEEGSAGMVNDEPDALDDLEGHAPALVIDCAPLLARVVEMVGRDGVVYRLRDDVPTQRLLWAFRLLDLERAIKDATTWEAREAAIDERERERLNLATTIVRHSYPQLTRARIGALFTDAQLDELLGYFFTTRLLPLLAQRLASANSEQSAAQTETPDAETLAAPTTPAKVARTASRAGSVGATRSRKR